MINLLIYSRIINKNNKLFKIKQCKMHNLIKNKK
jgi:hypothetical protein